LQTVAHSRAGIKKVEKEREWAIISTCRLYCESKKQQLFISSPHLNASLDYRAINSSLCTHLVAYGELFIDAITEK